MKPRRVKLKNGLEIVVKPVEEGFVPGDPLPEGVKIGVHCGWDFENSQSNFDRGAPTFAAWHRAQGKMLGCYCPMILAWAGNEVVGMLSFCDASEGGGHANLPVGFEMCCPYCKQTGEQAASIDACDVRPLKCDTIALTCAFSVAPRLKRQGAATAMLEYLIDMARAYGWKHIKATACMPETPDNFWPQVALMERAGFHRVGDCFDMDGGRVRGCDVQLDL